MSPHHNPAGATVSGARTKPLTWLGWTVILGFLAYFLAVKVPRYFHFTPESYGRYFWPRISWLFPHILCGLFAVIIGPLQFWPWIRREYLQFHRIAGRIYVGTVLIGSVAAVGLASGIGAEDKAYALGLTGLALAWTLTTGMAFVAIRRKNITQHKQWMVRSYVVTFAFVTFRLGDDLIAASGIMPEHERSAMLAWGCWALPLLVAEIAIQAGDVFKPRA